IHYRWHRSLDRLFEAKMAARADAVIANTPLNQQALAAAYPAQAHKIDTIPNGFEPAWFPPAPSFTYRDRFTLLHAGELYIGRDPRPLFEAVSRVTRATPEAVPWHVTFLGRSTE